MTTIQARLLLFNLSSRFGNFDRHGSLIIGSICRDRLRVEIQNRTRFEIDRTAEVSLYAHLYTPSNRHRSHHRIDRVNRYRE